MSSSDYGQVLRADILTYIWNLNIDNHQRNALFYVSFKSPLFEAGINNEWNLRLTLSRQVIILEIVDWNTIPIIKPVFEFVILNSDLQAFQKSEFKQVDVYRNENEDTIKYQNSLKFSIDDYLRDSDDKNIYNTKLRIMLEHKTNYNFLFDSRYHVLLDFEYLLHKYENSNDVVLKVEGKDLNAHKIILSARSSVFAAMFRQNMTEKEQNIVEIDDVSCDVMTELLRFIYCADVSNLKTLAIDLLVAADKYDIADLKALAENSLYQSLTIKNVAKVIHVAYLHDSCELLYMAADFIIRNYKHFGKNYDSSNFDSLSSLPPKLLSKLFLYACKSKQ